MSAFLLRWVTALLVCVILSSTFISQYQIEYVAMCILLVGFEYLKKRKIGEKNPLYLKFKKKRLEGSDTLKILFSVTT